MMISKMLSQGLYKFHEVSFDQIDLLAILQKGLDRALFLYILIHDVRLSGVRASITIMHIRKFYRM